MLTESQKEKLKEVLSEAKTVHQAGKAMHKKLIRSGWKHSYAPPFDYGYNNDPENGPRGHMIEPHYHEYTRKGSNTVHVIDHKGRHETYKKERGKKDFTPGENSKAYKEWARNTLASMNEAAWSHEDAKKAAHEEGKIARQKGHDPYCPFGPEVHHDYHEAWHKGYRSTKAFNESSDPYAETLAHISKKIKNAKVGWHSIFHARNHKLVVKKHDTQEQADHHVDRTMTKGNNSYVGASSAYHHGDGKWSWDGKLNEGLENPNPLSDRGETPGQKQMIQYHSSHMDVVDDEEMGVDHKGVSQSQDAIVHGKEDLEKYQHHTKLHLYHKKMASLGGPDEHTHKVAAHLHHVASDHFNQARDAMAVGDHSLASMHRSHGAAHGEKAMEYAPIKEGK